MTWYANSEGRFGANGAKGDLGEKLVEEYCVKNSIPFTPLSDRNSQVNLKLDCLIDGTPVDVKTNVSNNQLIVELYTNKKKPGWLYSTTADQIYGVDIEKEYIYRYNINDMRSYVRKNRHLARKIKKGDVLMWVSVNETFVERIQ